MLTCVRRVEELTWVSVELAGSGGSALSGAGEGALGKLPAGMKPCKERESSDLRCVCRGEPVDPAFTRARRPAGFLET